MAISFEDILAVCVIVAKDENINITLNESAKGAGITGLATFLGAIFGGPPGMVVGGVGGSLLAYNFCNNFRPLWQELENLKEHDRIRLERHITDIINKLDITDAITLMTLVSTETMAKKLICEALMQFAKQIS